jgi:iron complex transport system permease protein
MQVGLGEFNEALRVIADYFERAEETDKMFLMLRRPREYRAPDMHKLEGKVRWRMAGVYEKLGDAAREGAERERARASWPQVVDELVAGLGAFLVVTMVVAANIGAEPVPLAVIVESARNYLAGRPPGPDRHLADIFWILRLPRVAMGAIVGAALTVAGGSLQGLLMNPLADPYLVGVSAGAALGASAAIVFHFADLAGGAGQCLLAFGSGALTMVLVLWLARTRRRIGRESFILAGVVVGSFMWALVTLLMTVAGQDLQTLVFLLMGSLSKPREWTIVGVAAVLVAVGCVALHACGRDLNLLALGEEQARQLGVETEGLKIRVILFSALITAAAVSVSGIIGFVGLVIPHIARRLVGPDHRVLLPTAGLLGASFLVWTDTLARAIGEAFPVGVLTALLGAPFFFYLLKTRPQAV